MRNYHFQQIQFFLILVGVSCSKTLKLSIWKPFSNTTYWVQHPLLQDVRRTLHDLAKKSAGNNVACEKDEVAKKKKFSDLIKRDSLEGKCEPPESEIDLEGFFLHSSAPLLMLSLWLRNYVDSWTVLLWKLRASLTLNIFTVFSYSAWSSEMFRHWAQLRFWSVGILAMMALIQVYTSLQSFQNVSKYLTLA